MYHRILVGLSNAPGSWYALERALEYAARSGAHIVAIFAESPFWTPPPMGRRAFETVVRRRAERLARQYQGSLAFYVRHGFPARSIVEQARLLDCDLVVLGHASDGLLHRWLSASVSQLVRRAAPCSVVVVRSDRAPAPGEIPLLFA